LKSLFIPTCLALRGLAACAIISAVPAAHAMPQGSAAEFDHALDQFRQGRQAAAYGAFARLADHGDVEAARIALILLRHGDKLHGAAWGASQPQIDHWMRLARQPMAPLAAESGD